MCFSPAPPEMAEDRRGTAVEEDTTQDDNEETATPPLAVPPDGGWGWCVVAASFMLNAIVDGVIFSFGLFLLEFTTVMGVSKATTAWIGSLQAGCYLIVGPIVSALANQYGCRPVTIAGSIIASAAFVMSYFASNIVHLYLTFGLLAGIGFGFIYLPAIVTVGYYFEKRRALATGIAVCGSGVGAFIMAPLVQFLLENYGWRGALLILAGFVLNCAVFGSFFRPLTAPPPPRQKDSIFDDDPQRKPLLQRIKEARDMTKWDSDESVSNAIFKKQKSLRSCSLPVTPQMTPSILIEAAKTHADSTSGDDNIVSSTGNNSTPPPSYNEVMGNELITYLKNNHNNILRTLSNETKSELILNAAQKQQIRNRIKRDINRPFYRQDILFSASLIRIPEYRSQPDVHLYQRSITKIPKEEPEDTTSSCCLAKCSPDMSYTLKQMLDFSLLSSPTFIILSLSGFLALAGVFIPFIFLVDRAVLVGIPKEQATLLLSVIGVTNTIGRVFCGYISDKPCVSALFINNLALTLGGIATSLSPFFNSYAVLLIYGGIFGFSIACFAALRSVITVELLGLERLTNAFGLLLLFQGVATMVGSPIAGLFFDITGNYDASFYIAGSLIAVAGVMGFPLPALARWEKSRQHKATEVALEVIEEEPQEA